MNNMKNQSENKNSNPPQLKVYFDGLCKVCSKEINHYRKQVGAERIEFIDICSGNFDASAEELDPLQIHKVMHVRKADGTLATRVDAFIEIWSVLPKYRWLSKVAKLKPVKSGLEFGYTGFTLVRPFLPRSTNPADCQDSPYCEVKNA
jgi:predicted DCC family thiol-disulfide oxidoreductase YuxK